MFCDIESTQHFCTQSNQLDAGMTGVIWKKILDLNYIN